MNNDCSLCGKDMGPGMCGMDKETRKAICLDCWSEQHPEGMAPHPNLGFYILPAGTIKNQG